MFNRLVLILCLLASPLLAKDDAEPIGQEYNAVVANVVDGDTVDLRLDFPDFGLTINRRVRVYGINSHEIHSTDLEEKEMGLKDRDYALNLLPVGSVIKVRSFSPKRPQDKYGRWLAVITTPGGKDYASAMVKAGHAVEYFGGAR